MEKSMRETLMMLSQPHCLMVEGYDARGVEGVG